ncbi:mitochondrial ATPase inhibitor, IATP-domain-containing protein [Aspergillus spinulosporus]
MLRQSITRPISTTTRAILTRPFSAIAPRMGEGDTGAPRPGGAAQSDVWQKRETAQENLYMYEREKEKLEALKKKIQEQREHLNELDKHLDQFTKNEKK